MRLVVGKADGERAGRRQRAEGRRQRAEGRIRGQKSEVKRSESEVEQLKLVLVFDLRCAVSLRLTVGRNNPSGL
jgi:hypothetical protein